MKTLRLVRGAWLIVATLVLIAVLVAYDGKPNSDVGQFLIGAMVLISFPLALAGAAAIGAAYAIADLCCGIVVKTSYASLTLGWLVLTVVGYLQWFVLIPWALRHWRSRRVGRGLENPLD